VDGGEVSSRERVGGREAIGPKAQSGPARVRPRRKSGSDSGNTGPGVDRTQKRQPLDRGPPLGLQRFAAAVTGPGATQTGDAMMERPAASATGWWTGGMVNGQGSRSLSGRFGGRRGGHQAKGCFGGTEPSDRAGSLSRPVPSPEFWGSGLRAVGTEHQQAGKGEANPQGVSG